MRPWIHVRDVCILWHRIHIWRYSMLQTDPHTGLTSTVERCSKAVVNTQARFNSPLCLWFLAAQSGTLWNDYAQRINKNKKDCRLHVIVAKRVHCCVASSYPKVTFSGSVLWFSTFSISAAHLCSSRSISYTPWRKEGEKPTHLSAKHFATPLNMTARRFPLWHKDSPRPHVCFLHLVAVVGSNGCRAAMLSA